KNENVEITKMSEKEKEDLEKLTSKNNDIIQLEKKIKKDGFTEFKLNDENSKLKYIIKNQDGKKEYGFIVSTVYKNTKTKEIIVSELIYDSYHNKITKFVAEKRKQTENKEGKLIVNKNYIAQEDNQNAPQAVGFKWNGKAFACSMGGLYACAHYCGVWAIVNPIAGAGCEVVCGTAFAAACSLN
ncbi:putative immunity/bacteriocin fusion bifunctional protein, partial [Staphylococcus lutrae]